MCDWDDAEQTDTWENTAHGDWMRYGIPEFIPNPRNLTDAELEKRCRTGWTNEELGLMEVRK